MNTFTRADVTLLRNELEAALATVAAKHDLIISLGNCRFGSDQARFSKLTILTRRSLMHSVSVSSNALDPYNTLESRNYLQSAAMYGLPADGLGKQFRATSGRIFTITGFKPSRRKYPVSGVGAQGGRYKFTLAQVKAGLVK